LVTGDGSEMLAALLGMPGFVVVSQAERGGELWVWVRTTTEVAGCAGCGTRAQRHGRRRVLVRDLPVAGRPVVLLWSKQIWRCPERDCDVATWTESSEHIAPRRCLTERARAEICRRVGQDKDTVAEVAAAFGVSWATAMEAVTDYGTPLVQDPDRTGPTQALGLDDVNFARGRHDQRARWATVAVDLGTAEVIDVFEGRDTLQVRAWLDGKGPTWCHAVTVLSIDPHEGYRSAAIRPSPDGHPARTPNARVVADPFHIISLFNERITRTRQRVQRQTRPHRGQGGDPLYDIRRKLVIGYERLSDTARTALSAGLEHGDPAGHVRELWAIKEQMRAVLAIGTISTATAAFDTLITRCAASEVPEARSLNRTLCNWRHEILASKAVNITNARCEATNLNVEELVRRARGFSNFANYRLRIILALGVQWQTHRTARLRGRRPRSIA
jgi:transposase